MVVGAAVPPARLVARARRTTQLTPGEPLLTLIADLRGHIPRRVGVVGSGAEAGPVAKELHERGLPVVLHTDDDVTIPDVPTQRVTDRGEAMDVADDLLALIGNTPMVRLDRTARDVDCHLVAKLELFNPGFSSKDRPAPACLAPIAEAWEPRRSFAGTYDAAWQQGRAPYLPTDLDPRFLASAVMVRFLKIRRSSA